MSLWHWLSLTRRTTAENALVAHSASCLCALETKLLHHEVSHDVDVAMACETRAYRVPGQRETDHSRGKYMRQFVPLAPTDQWPPKTAGMAAFYSVASPPVLLAAADRLDQGDTLIYDGLCSLRVSP